MLECVHVAGELKVVEADLLEHYLEEEQWRRCPCCDGIFSTARSSRNKKRPGWGDCDWAAWILTMPITRPRANYCCAYCRQLHNRHQRQKVKGSRSVRLLNQPMMESDAASDLVADLGLAVKSTAKEVLPDYEQINMPHTLAHKLYLGTWRICANRECPNWSRIHYTERRTWQIQTRPHAAVLQAKYEELAGDRLIGLLDLDYEPQLVSMNWHCCSAKCRAAYQRALPLSVREERRQERELQSLLDELA
jgi:hypothetical protein